MQFHWKLAIAWLIWREWIFYLLAVCSGYGWNIGIHWNYSATLNIEDWTSIKKRKLRLVRWISMSLISPYIEILSLSWARGIFKSKQNMFWSSNPPFLWNISIGTLLAYNHYIGTYPSFNNSKTALSKSIRNTMHISLDIIVTQSTCLTCWVAFLAPFNYSSCQKIVIESKPMDITTKISFFSNEKCTRRFNIHTDHRFSKQ